MANDAELTDGASFDGSVLLVFRGVNLPDAGIEVYKAGVYYTPLTSSPSTYSYTIADNGVYTIVIDGVMFATFSVSGVNVPSFLPALIRAYRTDYLSASVPTAHRDSTEEVRNGNCINYPFKSIPEWPNFGILINTAVPSDASIVYVNCALNSVSFESQWLRLNVSVIDESSPSCIEIDGFIVAVFNYEQQRRRRR